MMRRELSPSLEYFRGVEVQVRGALHDHAMVWSPVPLGKTKLRGLAMRAGFGHSLDLAPAPPGSKRAAYYVSKYVTKATDVRDSVPWLPDGFVPVIDQVEGVVLLNPDTGEVRPGQARYRTWSMSRQWGLTMAAVRAECRAWVAARELELEERAFELLVAAFDCVPIDQSSSPPS